MIIAILIVILIGVLIFYRVSTPALTNTQKYSLITLRFIYCSIVAVLLFNPILNYFQKITQKDKIVILIDDSQSMQLNLNNKSKSSYLKIYQKQLIDKCQTLDLDYALYNLSDYNQMKQQSSYLLPFLESLKKKENSSLINSIFLLSDGYFHDEDLSAINALDIPIYSFVQPDTIIYSDLSVEELIYNKNAYRSENNSIKAVIKNDNFNNDYKIQLIVDNKLVSEKNINKNSDVINEITFEYQFTKLGLSSFYVKIKANNDNYTDNNQAIGAIQVLESKQKIILISDLLNYDLKYLSALIKDNVRYQADVFIKQNNRYFLNAKETKPDFASYTSMILFNNSRLFFNAEEQNLIEKLCANSFGILMFGYPIQTLQQISPVTTSNISNLYKADIMLTPYANQFELFDYMKNDLSNLPSIQYYYVNAKNTAKVLACLDNESRSPLISYQNYLNSHILSINGFDLWKWQANSTNNQYQSFFNYLIDWISRKQSDNFYAFTEKNNYKQAENVEIVLNAFDETLSPMTNISPKITLKRNNQLLNEDYLALTDTDYKIKYSSLKPGKYHYEIIEERKKYHCSGEFIVDNTNRELFETGVNHALLAWISNTSKGALLDENSFKTLDFSKHKPKIIKLHKEIQLYKKNLLLILFILSISLEYFFRKRWGLL